MIEEPLRVLRIITRMNVGGPAVQVTNLMQGLRKERFDQRLIVGLCSGDELDYLKTHAISLPVVLVKSLSRSINPVRDFLAFIEIRKQILEFRPNIVHTHTFKAGLLGRIASLSVNSKIKVVHTYHGHLLHGYFGRFGVFMLVFIEKLMAKFSSKLIAVGLKVQNDLLQVGIGTQAQFCTINPGFDLLFLPSSNTKSNHRSEKDFICGWIGRLTKIKRFDRVIEISKILKSMKQDNIRFIVAGDGPEKYSLEKEVEENKLPIEFQGWRPNIQEFISNCDIVICTSENEGTPISLIEAQMLGKPVISTNVGSASEVFISNKSGFLVDYDAQLFAEKIVALQENKYLYDSFSTNGREYATKTFSRVTFIERHAELYESLIHV